MQKTQKAVVITGASSGIGRACVLQMSRAGWQVFATVRKAEDKDRLEAAAIPGLTPVMMDIEDPASIVAAAEEITSHLGGLDGLVNVAGIGMVGPVEYITPHDWQHIFNVNVFGQIAVTQAFLPLIRRKRGRIANISSVGAHIAIPFAGLLNASKSAFGCLSDTLRLELHPFRNSRNHYRARFDCDPRGRKNIGECRWRNRQSSRAGTSTIWDNAQERHAARIRKGEERKSPGSGSPCGASCPHREPTSVRYRVGKDARLIATLPGVLPDWLLDEIRFRALGLPTEFGAVEKVATGRPLNEAA